MSAISTIDRESRPRDDVSSAQDLVSRFCIILRAYDFDIREHDIACDLEHPDAPYMVPSVYHVFRQWPVNGFTSFEMYRSLTCSALDLTLRELILYQPQHTHCERDVFAIDRGSRFYHIEEINHLARDCPYAVYNSASDTIMCPLLSRALCNIELTAHLCSPRVKSSIRRDANDWMHSGVHDMRQHIVTMRAFARTIREQVVKLTYLSQCIPQHMCAHYCALLDLI